MSNVIFRIAATLLILIGVLEMVGVKIPGGELLYHRPDIQMAIVFGTAFVVSEIIDIILGKKP
jgi:hypothetical protein